MNTSFTFIMLALLVNVSTHAAEITPQSTWEEIKAAGLVAEFSTVFFKTEGVTVDELCIDGDNLRPVQPYRTTCVEFDPRFNHCVRTEKSYLTTSRTRQVSQCVKYDHDDLCSVWKSQTSVINSSYLVSVSKRTIKNDRTEVFKKRFEIPACQ